MKFKALEMIDAYKIDHRRQYPPGITRVYSNWTPRKISIPGVDKVVFFGLQAFLKEMTEAFDEFFAADVDEVCADYEQNITEIIGPNDIGTQHIRDLHRLGYLPLEFRALPEGAEVYARVPMFTVENTHPDFFWLVNYLETWLSAHMWMPCTSATLARQLRRTLNRHALATTGSVEGVEFQGHDFSMRGHSSVLSAAMSGAGHLLSFVGTDTLPAKSWVKKYYGAEEPIALSVAATEHSVMCAGGQDGEFETYNRLLDLYPNGILAVVSDTWDLWSVITDILPALKEKILARDGKLVIRPDCYAEGTSIFTNRGWVDFAKLEPSDLVAQVLDDGSYEFVKPLKYIEQEYSGPMYRFSDKMGKVDFLVTPNHRMIMESNGEQRVVFAENMLSKGHHYQHMRRSAVAPISGRALSPLERLKIAFQADGSFQTGVNKIRFSFSKSRKMDRLEAILEEAGISYKKYPLTEGRFEYSLDAPATEFSKGFEWIDLGTLDGEWCREFIEELSYWDASRRSDGRFKFDSTDKTVIDVVEIIALSAGFGALVSHATDDRKEIFSDVFAIHIMKDNRVGGQSWKKTVEDYDGKVYCVQVPTGRILVKNNRATLVCGNSGDPADILCGLNTADGDTGRSARGRIDFSSHNSEDLGVIELLWEIFGGTVNDLGYKVLDHRIGAIYGDSITHDTADEICRRLAEKGFASTNVVFGMGSFFYQGGWRGEKPGWITRDTFGFAMKATNVTIDGQDQPIFKDPVTDSGTKKSAKGLISVVVGEDGEYRLLDECDRHDVQAEYNKMALVYRNGKLLVDHKFNDIRSF